MNNGSLRRLDARPAWRRGVLMLAVTLGIGIAVASDPFSRSWVAKQWHSITEAASFRDVTRPIAQHPIAQKSKSIYDSISQLTTPMGSDSQTQNDATYAANNQVVIGPVYREGGQFIGYRVVGRSGDYRFNNGAIVVSINGIPVENSAAGSELLLIAIAQTGTQLGMLEQ